MEQLRLDVRYALRSLKKAPLFTSVALLSLALGIGANAAMFSVIDAVLLRPMPFPDPDRLVTLKSHNEQRGFTLEIFSPGEIPDYRAETSIFAGVSAFRSTTGFLTDNGSQRVSVHSVDETFFDTVQRQPMMGRTFTADEMRPGAPRLTILQYDFWQRRFAADPQILGRTITLNDNPYTVIGIMPPGFESPNAVKTDLWTPLVIQPNQAGRRGIRFLSVIGRLQANVSLKQAQERMTAVSTGLAERYPEDHKGWELKIVGLQESVVGDKKLPLLVLFGAVFAVLLIASTNVASLMSSRGSARRSEIAIRTALGASRLRVIRQILIESSLLSIAGGIAGLLMASVILDAFLAIVPPGLPRLTSVGIDARVLLFSFSLIVLTAMLFGWLPAREASQTDPNRWLGTGRRNGDNGRSKGRSVLVVIEVALTLVLVTGAALLFHSFVKLQAVDTGLRAEDVVTFTVSGPPSSGARKPEFLDTLLTRIQSHPNVQSAALAGVVPLRGFKMVAPVRIEGVTEVSQKVDDMAAFNYVTGNYFGVFEIPVVQGRGFDPGIDRKDGPKVAVVNQSLARRFFNGDPIGRRLRLPGLKEDTFAEIIGVVADFHQSSPGTPVHMEMYVPTSQQSEIVSFVAIRTIGDPSAFMATLPGLVQSLDNRVVVEMLATVKQLQWQAVGEERFRTMLVSAYSALAVILSAIGVYSVVAYSTIRRRREIGIRMALGGPNGSILRMLLWQGFMPCLIGIVLGFAGSLAVARSIQSLLFNVSPMDPLTLASSVALVACAGLSACAIPAVRALSVDPLITLKD